MPAVTPDRPAPHCALPVLALALLAGGCQPGGPPPWHPEATAQQIARGRALMAQYQCGSCHAIPGVAAAQGKVGPALSAFGRRSYIAGEWPNTQQTLARWLVAPDALVPGTAMPAMGVSPADARDMAAYLLALE